VVVVVAVMSAAAVPTPVIMVVPVVALVQLTRFRHMEMGLLAKVTGVARMVPVIHIRRVVAVVLVLLEETALAVVLVPVVLVLLQQLLAHPLIAVVVVVVVQPPKEAPLERAEQEAVALGPVAVAPREQQILAVEEAVIPVLAQPVLAVPVLLYFATRVVLPPQFLLA